jgi:hypothetical protein
VTRRCSRRGVDRTSESGPQRPIFTEQVVLLLAPGPNAPLDAADCTDWAALKPQHDPGRKVGCRIHSTFVGSEVIFLANFQKVVCFFYFLRVPQLSSSILSFLFSNEKLRRRNFRK